MTGCTLNDCHHRFYRDRIYCKRRLQAERLNELDHKEKLIHEERIQIMLDAERDLPMPGHDTGSDDCPSCRALRP